MIINKNKGYYLIACSLLWVSSIYSKIYKLTPWMIRVKPIRIGANCRSVSENPPRANEIIPKIIINTEAIFDMFSSENMPAIPNRTSRIPII